LPVRRTGKGLPSAAKPRGVNVPNLDSDTAEYSLPFPSETVVHRDPLDRTTVVQVSGELDLANAGRLEAALCEAVARPNERLMIDLSDCVFVDTSAIGSLLRARRALDRDADAGPPMVLVANRPHVLRALGLTGLDQIVPTMRDRHRALDLLHRFA
jgi:anti-sigma B factor antagonist